MILTRHAEAFFWAGRYLERAEAIARTLDVTTRAAMYADSARAAETWRSAITGLGLSAYFDDVESQLVERDVAMFLLSDPDNPGSVRRSIEMLRENLRTARERVPIELWEEASRLYLRVSSTRAERSVDSEPRELYSEIRQSCQAVSGVIAESMTRDEGHAFLVMGRMIERSTITLRLLEVVISTEQVGLDEDSVLRATSSMQAFHRMYGHGATLLQVASFLLHEAAVPRSVLACMIRLSSRLDSVGDADNIARPQQLVGRLRSRLEFQEVQDQLHQDPATALGSVRAELNVISDSIGAHLFHSSLQPAPTAQFIRPGLSL